MRRVGTDANRRPAGTFVVHRRDRSTGQIHRTDPQDRSTGQPAVHGAPKPCQPPCCATINSSGGRTSSGAPVLYGRRPPTWSSYHSLPERHYPPPKGRSSHHRSVASRGVKPVDNTYSINSQPFFSSLEFPDPKSATCRAVISSPCPRW
jgi:hypothetical protein